MSNGRDDKRDELLGTGSDSTGRDDSIGATLDQILGDGFSQDDTGDYGGKETVEKKELNDNDLDELMGGGQKTRIGLILLLLSLAVIVGIVVYVMVDPVANVRVTSFLRGDLLKMDKQKVDDMARQYDEKVAQLQEKTGNIMLQYFPPTARVNIIQQAMVQENIDDKDRKPFGDPLVIDNESLHLGQDEELPELNIQNLPIRERGKMCIPDGRFYPASQIVCPGWEKCLSSQPVEEEPVEAAKGDEKKEGEDKAAEAPAAGGGVECNTHFANPEIYSNENFCASVPTECKEACDCFKHTLKVVDYCPEDKEYYPATSGMIQNCPNSDVPMDPTRVPLFTYTYSFMFEAEDFLPSVVSYSEENWKSLGSGRYVILFPKDFSLLRNWEPVLEKFQQASKAMRCWDRTWEKLLEDGQRKAAVDVAREEMATVAKKKEELRSDLKAGKAQYEWVVNEIGTLRKVMKMATIIDGRGEIYWFCLKKGKCEEANLNVLLKEDLETWLGVVALMDPDPKRRPELAAEMAKRKILSAGIVCLDKWVDLQAESKEPGGFIRVDDKKGECDAAIAGLKAISPEGAKVLTAIFKDPTAGAAAVAGDKAQYAEYFLSKAEYGEKPVSYEDMILKNEVKGRHIDFLRNLYLYDYNGFTEMMGKLVQSRQANHVVDAKANGYWVDPAKGYKAAMELAWWIGLPPFNEFYMKVWEYDVQACLLFLSEHDKARFDVDRKKFQELMGRYEKVKREHQAQAMEFKSSLTRFQAIRETLARENNAAKVDRKEFAGRYNEAVMAGLQTSDPDLYAGLLYLVDSKAGSELMKQMATLPEAGPGEAPKQEGDQPLYHKYLAYMEIFNRAELDRGFKLLEKRMEPFFMTEDEYTDKVKSNPNAPAYNALIGDLVNNDIPMKYFWLLKLIESPARFEQEISRLDMSKALLVSKSLDARRYKYLRDLVWLKPEINRDSDVIPMFEEWSQMDLSILDAEKANLTEWSKRKAATERKFKRSKAAAAWLLEPTMVERALDNSLKMTDRYALLMNNLEQYEESEIISAVGTQIRDEGQQVIETLSARWKKYGEPGNQDIRAFYGFTEARWSPLVDEVKITFPKWYTFLDEGLRNSRADCTQPTCLPKWLDCKVANVEPAEEGKEVQSCNDRDAGIILPPCE